MKRYEKVIFSSIGVLYVVFMLFSFICLDRTDTVHYYPALTVRTDSPRSVRTPLYFIRRKGILL